MFKLLLVLVALAIGFGGGVYWGVKNPAAASDLAKKEEEWFLKGKMEATKAITEKLDKVLAKETTKTGAPRSTLFGETGSGNSAATAEALRKIRDEEKQQLADLQRRLQQKPK